MRLHPLLTVMSLYRGKYLQSPYFNVNLLKYWILGGNFILKWNFNK